MPIRLTRKEAKAQGQIRYFTGTPCIYGHVSERLTSNGACMECLRITSAKNRGAIARPRLPQVSDAQAAANARAVEELNIPITSRIKEFMVPAHQLALVAAARAFNRLAYPEASEGATDPRLKTLKVVGSRIHVELSVAAQYREAFRLQKKVMELDQGPLILPTLPQAELTADNFHPDDRAEAGFDREGDS